MKIPLERSLEHVFRTGTEHWLRVP